jgi:putative DNA primase/helicase
MSKNLKHNIIIHTKASEIKMQPINWLWKERFARGKISIISGDPGLGKSQIIASMAAAITTGKNWHDGANCPQGKVIILSAEDGNADTLVPRLHAAGANLELIHIIDSIKNDTDKKIDRQLNLASDINALENLLNEVENIMAIFIDPITGYLGNVDDHKNSQVRAVFLGVSQLAEKHNIAIICVSHNNKNEASKALLRVIGSIAYVATARAVFAVIEKRDFHLLLKNILLNIQLKHLALPGQTKQSPKPLMKYYDFSKDL